LLMESLERKAKKMITEYTFFDLGKEDAQWLKTTID
jgi:hypothetical protein